MSEADFSFTLNHRPVTLRTQPSAMLVDVLRNDYGLFGCRIGCDQAVCGACTVLVDGTPMAACSTFIFEIEGRDVTTIEASGNTPDLVQQAFIDARGFQCGYCTGGMILLTRSLLARNPDPDDDTIRAWLGANVCRCTGYSSIIDAVKAAGRMLRQEAVR